MLCCVYCVVCAVLCEWCVWYMCCVYVLCVFVYIDNSPTANENILKMFTYFRDISLFTKTVLRAFEKIVLGCYPKTIHKIPC